MPRINPVTPVVSTTVGIHNIVILDRSGSMQGEKYHAAVEGIKMDYETCKKEGFKSYTFAQFDDTYDCKTYDFTKELMFLLPKGWTALYDAIYNTLTDTVVPEGDKVLVKIFTDGEENHSSRSASEVQKLIKSCEAKGYTITFVGTKHDVRVIQSKLSIDASNTAVHDNTGAGVQEVFRSYSQATALYTKSIANGEDTTRGFFTKTIKTN
jgi:uncharacterized protein YegL